MARTATITGQKLTADRIASGLSMTSLASHLGLSRASIYRAENDLPVSRDVIHKLTVYLELVRNAQLKARDQLGLA